VITSRKAQAVAPDAGERFECRTGGAAAVRTMAIQRVFERIRHLIGDRTAKAFAAKNTSIRLF